jgi:hypothetical protein
MSKKGQFKVDVLGWYMQETGKTAVDMHDVARWALTKGWKLPKPADPIDLLAKQFSRAAREQTRRDPTTGRSYRAYHSFPEAQGEAQLVLWVDIDKAARKPMVKSVNQRREQMVGDAVQLTFDIDHWNGIHPSEEPITVPLDFAPDVEWRKNSPIEDDEGKDKA